MKVVTRHIWEPYMEKCEDIRHTIGMKEVYAQRKETVERLFGTAKENHGFRYTQMIGKARMEMKVGLTFACMNLKKLAKMIARKGKRGTQKCLLLIKYTLFEPKTRKTLLVIYALSDFLIMILSWLVKQSLRAFLFQEVQP